MKQINIIIISTYLIILSSCATGIQEIQPNVTTEGSRILTTQKIRYIPEERDLNDLYVSTERIEVNNPITARKYVNQYLHSYLEKPFGEANQFQILINEISENDFQNIVDDILIKYELIFNYFPEHHMDGFNNSKHYDKESRIASRQGRLDYDWDNDLAYIQELSKWNINYGYSKTESQGILIFGYRGYTDSSYNWFPINRFVNSLIDSSIYSFEGYKISQLYTSNKREINGSSSGGIVIEIVLDNTSEISMGGFSGITDEDGLFRFSGDPSLSKIVDGIIPIRDSLNNEVIALFDEKEELWYVEVIGQKAGQPFTTKLIIESLNN